MSKALLGMPFDIHTGGIDHREIHHPNEIAQNQAFCCTNGLDLAANSGARVWMHNNFLVERSGKMSKSSGEFLRLQLLVDKFEERAKETLALIEDDFGIEVSKAVARDMVVYHRRSGGQSQFSTLNELKAPTGRFGSLLTWARENLDAPLTVEDLAEQAGMSSRHFTRAFMAETGTTPSKAVERLRIEVAKQRVQSSSEAIERVAELTGFRDPERMRRAFIRAFGQPPQSLCRAARAG